MEEPKEMGEDILEKIIEKCFSWVKDKYDRYFLLVLLAAFIIRVWVFIITKDQALWFDAAEYMSTSKYWAGIGQMSDIWYYRRGFFWPLFGSLFFKIGLGDTAIRFATVLFSTGTVAVSYFLIKNMFNKKYALFACIGISFSWVFLFFTGRPMTDIPSTFFLLLSLLFFWKGYELKQGNKFLYLFALFFALSILTRMQNLVFTPIFFIFIFIKKKFKFVKNKSLWIAFLIFILVLSPLIIMYTQHFGNPVVDILSYIFGVNNPEALTIAQTSFTNLPMYFLDLPYNLTKPIFILFIIGILLFFTDLFLGFDKIFKNKNIQKKFFVFLWILIPLLFLGYLSSYPEQRYTLAQHPFLFLIASIPLFAIGRIIKKNFKINKKFLTFILLALFISAFIPNVLWAKQLIDNKKDSYYELKLAGEWIKENSDLNDIIITNSFPQISYYSERRVATFASCYNNPESHLPSCSREEFDAYVEDVKPKFMLLSVFQGHEPWMLNYPSEHNDTLIPEKAFYKDGQVIVAIYKFNWS